MLYRGFSDLESLDREYNPVHVSPDEADTLERVFSRSRSYMDRAEHLFESVRIGATLDESVVVVRPKRSDFAERRPVVLFLHGGYWRGGSPEDFALVAENCVEMGAIVILGRYSLCPKVTIDEIVRQARAIVYWVHNHVSDYGGDNKNVSLVGHSAGAQLVAMCGCADWSQEYGLECIPFRSTIMISGLYDLRPLPYTYAQPALQLTWDQVYRNSPSFLQPRFKGPALIAGGQRESAEFRRQSEDFSNYWRSCEVECECALIPGLDHFTIVEALSDRDTDLFSMVATLVFRD